MGLFKRLFGDVSEEATSVRKSLNWIPLNEPDHLDQILERSELRPQIIYKHSTTCGISSMVLNMFIRAYDFEEDKADLYFLDIHQYRNISNALAERTGVRHESPQLIIIRNGEVLVHTSHGAIADLDLARYL